MSLQLTTKDAKTLMVDCCLIDDSGRIRTDYSHVEELAASIAAHGQLQPVVLSTDNKLVAGGSRLRAVRDILKLPTIPAVYIETLSEDHLRLLEVEENIRRKDLLGKKESWESYVFTSLNGETVLLVVTHSVGLSSKQASSSGARLVMLTPP